MGVREYFSNLGVETDTWLSVVTGGPRGVTISRRVAEACQAASGSGHPSCLACRVLSLLVERDHCSKVLRDEATHLDAALRAGLILGPAFVIIAGAPILLIWLL